MKRSKLLQSIYAIIVVFIIWMILHLLMDSFVIPNPINVLKRFVSIVIPVLIPHVLVSSYRLIIALLITTLIGYSIGLLLGINKKVDSLVSPIVYLFYPVPRIAFLPVFMILFGLSDLSKIVLIIAIAVFQIIISIRDGVGDIPYEIILSARSLKLDKKNMIRHIYIPATLAKLFTSLRIALGSSMAALFFAENYATTKGIGYFIMNSWIKVDYEGMYSGIIAISIFGMVLFKLIDILQDRMVKG